MDGTERDNSRYMLNYVGNDGYGSTRIKVSGRSLPQSQSQLIVDSYVDVDDEVDEDQEEGDAGDGETNGLVKRNGGYVDNDDDGDDTNDNNDDDDEDDDDEDNGGDGFNVHRHPKKRKLKSLSSSFELAPRVTLPPLALVAPTPPAVKPGRRNTLTDWTERETFVLLDAWGERFLQRGRKSLRSEEWQEVAEKVSQGSKLERSDTQCRNRLDTLKKKYKKEKALLELNKSANTTWVYFKKMNMLMVAAPPPPQQAGLSCGVDKDSREFVFTNRANVLDEMRDSLGNAHSQDVDDDDNDDDDDDDDLDLLPPKKSRYIGEKQKVNDGSFKLLADSINQFSEIYLKIENAKRKQMVELEKMRMDFYKDLELQKQKIFDKARDEIANKGKGY